jgi:uncharacterized Zn finger protein
MRTKLPPCPRCDDVLRLLREGDKVTASCWECGWTTGVITLATGEDIGEVIGAKVSEAQAIDTADEGNA